MSQGKGFEQSLFFKDLSPEEKQWLIEKATLKKLARGEQLLKESEVGDTIFLVGEGRVEVKVSLAGTQGQETLATLGEGEVIGEMILLGKTRRTASVMAKDDVTLYQWNVDELKKLFHEKPRIGYLIMQQLAQQLAQRLEATNQLLRNVLKAY